MPIDHSPVRQIRSRLSVVLRRRGHVPIGGRVRREFGLGPFFRRFLGRPFHDPAGDLGGPSRLRRRDMVEIDAQVHPEPALDDLGHGQGDLAIRPAGDFAQGRRGLRIRSGRQCRFRSD